MKCKVEVEYGEKRSGRSEQNRIGRTKDTRRGWKEGGEKRREKREKSREKRREAETRK
jgi:hypothetical protein